MKESNGRKNLGKREEGDVLSQWRRRLQLQYFNFMREVKLLLRVPRVVKSPLRFTLHPSPHNIRFANARIHGRPSFRPGGAGAASGQDPAIILICLGAICFYFIFYLSFHFISILSTLCSASIPLITRPHLRIKVSLSNLVE